MGLPAPDLTLFLNISPEAAAARGGYGAERYETAELQMQVRKVFQRIGQQVGFDQWREVDAGRSVEQVAEEIEKLVLDVVHGPAREERGLWQ